MLFQGAFVVERAVSFPVTQALRRYVVPVAWRLGLVLPLMLAPWLGRADAMARQILFRWRGPLTPPDNLVLLGIDEASLDAELADFGPWPWPRAVQATLAREALRKGAKSVVFNIVFAGPSAFGPADDQTFRELLKPWKEKVYLSASYVHQELDGFEQAELRLPQERSYPIGLSQLSLNSFGVVKGIPGSRRLDAMLRHFPLPHPAPLAHVATGVPVPIEERGIDFLGPRGHIPMIPAWSVETVPEAQWRDRIVIVGATALSLGDQLETPFGQQSGSEVLGSAIAGLLSGRGFRHLALGTLVAISAAWLLLCHWRIAASSTALKTVISVAALAFLSLGITVAAWCSGIWLPGAALLLVPVVGGTLLSAEQFRVETRQRRFLHSVLSRRVSPNLMRNMLRSGADVWTQLGGQRVRCVVLFTDLIGFTARSSAMEPEQLFTLLNRYFEVMSAPVLAEQGLLDKFIGDSVMAEFGVPQHRGDREEALAAVRTALAMQRNLHQLNKELAEEGQEPLRHGIGIHCGDVVAGNLGSSQRLEYTVIGGSVNVASRLESLTRLFPQHSILISREVLDLLSENVRVEALGSHAVKGWPDPIEVFSLIDLID